MYCKKCGSELDESLLCTTCGFQNVLEEPQLSSCIEHNNNISVTTQNMQQEPKNTTVSIVRNKIWAIVSIVMFCISIIPLYKGYDKMNNYYSSDTYYSLNKNAYVGGDAYNYIINAGYATAYYVLAIGFAILGVGFLIVYYLSGRKVK